MLSKRLNAVGGFDFQIAQDTPVDFRRFPLWSWVVFTSARLFEPTISRANLLLSASFTGPIINREFEGSGAQYAGPGLLALLGDAQGKGPATTALSESSGGNFTSIWTTGAGNVFGTATRVNGLQQLAAPDNFVLTDDLDFADGKVLRPELETQLALQANVTANMDMYVSALGRVALAYPSNNSHFAQTPQVVVWPGPTTVLPGVNVAERVAVHGEMVYRDDAEEFATGAVVTRSGGRSRSTKSHGLKAFNGTDDLYMEVAEEDTSLSSGKGGALARKLSAEHDYRYEISCTVEANPTLIKPGTTGARGYLEPGDYVYLYDPDIDLSDTANQINVAGQVIHPKKFRCIGIDFPVIDGMGVYVAANDWSTIVDVSDYVEWETGDAELEIGEAVVPKTIKSLVGF